jgi:RNA polymerase sigma-70 factor (ECF subfamily)
VSLSPASPFLETPRKPDAATTRSTGAEHAGGEVGPEVLAQAMLDDARLVWPDVSVSPIVFARRVRRASAGAGPAGVHARDLYFACALEEHDPGALAALEVLLAQVCPPALRRLDPTPEFLDEVRQLLRYKLLTASIGGVPEIARYSGRGPLHRWLRALALTTALMLRRARHQEVLLDSPAAWEESVARSNPELEHVVRRYREHLRGALSLGLSQLTARERTLLRLNMLCGLNIDEISRLFKVHRATVARWIADARGTLVSGTRTELARRLCVPSPELDSLLQKVHSQLHLSLNELLAQMGS